jgi:hypothetical protein
MSTVLVFVLVGIMTGVVLFVVFLLGDANGYSRGIKFKDGEIKTAVKLGYDRGVKDSEKYVIDSMKKGMDIIEAELNKKGFTLKDDPKKPETEKDKKIAEALNQQRKKLEAVQSTSTKPKSPLKLVKDPPKLTIIKNEDK